jgi:hypothetical protein
MQNRMEMLPPIVAPSSGRSGVVSGEFVVQMEAAIILPIHRALR